MIITTKFCWAHFGKTGGNSTRVMFDILELDDILVAHGTGEPEKHRPFADYPDLCQEKPRLLNIRRLPMWLASRWHHLYRDSVIEKIDIAAIRSGLISTKTESFSLTADRALERYVGSDGKVGIDFWLRTEYLGEDFIRAMEHFVLISEDKKAKIKSVKVNRGNDLPLRGEKSFLGEEYTDAASLVKKFFTPQDIKKMYDQNPLWAKIEKEVYGDLLYEWSYSEIPASTIQETQSAKRNRSEENIVVCATAKNEAPYLLEWIAYHRVMKVDHFVIYNNDSTDETAEILKALDKAGIITCVEWPSKPDCDNQLAAYRDALSRLADKCEWMAFIDCDEFIVPHKQDDLKSFLAGYEGAEGIAINWKVFGSSGHLGKTDGLVMERFTRCSKSACPANGHFKTIARPRRIKEFINPHAVEFEQKDSAFYYPNRTEVPSEKRGRSIHIDHDLIQINHYFTKSREEWALKRARGRATVRLGDPKKIRSEDHFQAHDRNEEGDVQILRFLEKTKQEIEFLKRAAGFAEIRGRADVKPLLTAQAIRFVEDLLKRRSDARVLEFGSGNSTVWFSRRTQGLVSIEHDPVWYEKIKAKLEEEFLSRKVDYRFLRRPYHAVCEEFPAEHFDLIIVDGRDRIKCLEASTRILKKGGILMLDDAQRERYQQAFEVLKGWGLERTAEPARETYWWQKPLGEGDEIPILSEEKARKHWARRGALERRPDAKVSTVPFPLLWEDVLKKRPLRLYAGDLSGPAKKDGWIGVSLVKSDAWHIKHDLTKPFPLQDNVVDAFQSEDVFEHIHPSILLAVTLPEIYRIMKPGGFIRISVPDYRCEFLYKRSWRDEQGKPYFDPGPVPNSEGKSGPIDRRVMHRGHIWFPTYEQVWSLIEMSPLRYCRADWLHYYADQGRPVMKRIDYGKGYVLRTPDHDPRVQKPRCPLSIVVDLYKAADAVKPKEDLLGFDWKFYVGRYLDLQKAGINTKEKAEAHYLKFGKKEGRRITPNT